MNQTSDSPPTPTDGSCGSPRESRSMRPSACSGRGYLPDAVMGKTGFHHAQTGYFESSRRPGGLTNSAETASDESLSWTRPTPSTCRKTRPRCSKSPALFDFSYSAMSRTSGIDDLPGLVVMASIVSSGSSMRFRQTRGPGPPRPRRGRWERRRRVALSSASADGGEDGIEDNPISIAVAVASRWPSQHADLDRISPGSPEQHGRVHPELAPFEVEVPFVEAKPVRDILSAVG